MPSLLKDILVIIFLNIFYYTQQYYIIQSSARCFGQFLPKYLLGYFSIIILYKHKKTAGSLIIWPPACYLFWYYFLYIINSSNLNWDFTCFERFNNCYILLLNSPQALENTGFIAGELFLIVSLVLYRPISVYELW